VRHLLTTDTFALVTGGVVGVTIWWLFIRPGQKDTHERRRRQHGLPPKRTLPEDEDR
jgi:hypothetical protein